MSTASEIQWRMPAADRWCETAAKAVWLELARPLTVALFGRKVHTKRARTLRRRGEAVVKVAPGVYRWLPRPFTIRPPT